MHSCGESGVADSALVTSTHTSLVTKTCPKKWKIIQCEIGLEQVVLGAASLPEERCDARYEFVVFIAGG